VFRYRITDVSGSLTLEICASSPTEARARAGFGDRAIVRQLPQDGPGWDALELRAALLEIGGPRASSEASK